MDGSNRNTRLIGFIERLERLAAEKKAISDDIAEVKRDAKAAGFDAQAIAQMLRERRMAPDERADYQALLEMYRAALGMLDGTPLGDAARRRLLPPDPQQPPREPGAPPMPTPEPAAATPQAPTADDIAAAHAQGREAARTGVKVTANPFAAGDARRAAWDEGWCAEAGSDGMAIPAAWARKKPKKPDPKDPS